MANRNVPVMMMDGREMMMTNEEANQYYNNLERTDQAAGIFPISRYNQLLKQSPKLASNFQNWYKGLANNKWGTKIFPGVSNLNVPVNVAKAGVPVVRSGFGSAVNILSNKAKLQLAGMGVAGTAGMGIGAYNKYADENNITPVINQDVVLPEQVNNYVSPKKLFANIKTVDPKTKKLFKNVKTVDPKIREQAINNIKEAEMRKAIAVVDTNKNVFLPKDTYITSDPGYKDGYRVDNVAASNPLSVYNIMDADSGSQGIGYEW